MKHWYSSVCKCWSRTIWVNKPLEPKLSIYKWVFFPLLLSAYVFVICTIVLQITLLICTSRWIVHTEMLFSWVVIWTTTTFLSAKTGLVVLGWPLSWTEHFHPLNCHSLPFFFSIILSIFYFYCEFLKYLNLPNLHNHVCNCLFFISIMFLSLYVHMDDLLLICSRTTLCFALLPHYWLMG